MDCVIEQHAQLVGFLQHLVVDQMNSAAVRGRHTPPDGTPRTFPVLPDDPSRLGEAEEPLRTAICAQERVAFFCVTESTAAGST